MAPRCRTRSTSATSSRRRPRLIDAADRCDEDRGIKFETCPSAACGAMIDALRKDAWPRGVRRHRRELDATRGSAPRAGHEPSMADLAARVGSDEKRLTHDRAHRLSKRPRRNTSDTWTKLAADGTRALRQVPTPPTSAARRATASAPRSVAAMARAGDRPLLRRSDDNIGARDVNESRVSQLHAARSPPRDALGDMNRRGRGDEAPADPFAAKKRWPRPHDPDEGQHAYTPETVASLHAVVMAFKPARAGAAEKSLRMPRQRQAIAAARQPPNTQRHQGTRPTCRFSPLCP